jgi:hypothetical protein
MAQESHTVTLGNVKEGNARIHVPVDVMRENDLDLSDEIEVTVSDIDGIVDQISFERPLMSGHSVAVTTRILNQVDLETGETYDMEFAPVETDDEPDDLDDAEFAVEADDEPAEESESESGSELGDLFEDAIEDDPSEEEESEEEGLGELFG